VCRLAVGKREHLPRAWPDERFPRNGRERLNEHIVGNSGPSRNLPRIKISVIRGLHLKISVACYSGLPSVRTRNALQAASTTCTNLVGEGTRIARSTTSSNALRNANARDETHGW
jgi:hypothetical protein